MNSLPSKTVPNERYIKSTRDTLMKYGHIPIKKIVVCRDPVNGMIDNLLNFLSFGSWKDIKSKHGFDEFYHLYALIYLANGVILMIEKNQNIIVDKTSKKSPKETLTIQGNYEGLILDGILSKEMEDYNGFFTYSAFNKNNSGNCQGFIENFLRSAGLLTDTSLKFINQNIEELAKDTPYFTKRLADLITDIGARIEGTVSEWTGKHFKLGGIVKKKNKKKFYL